ncbi:hypothetical protein KP509_17G064200 [Ceratopteris richardii]|uniref:Chlorophyll a-b binding protein, chloroplastic n=1 Tax=Ceratopteris richardii TaxID=49495 RepID=A0A8T2SWU7_CERRI|nr:hypothetical protein KP509_17G064200 [Ceratopteris richardii]
MATAAASATTSLASSFLGTQELSNGVKNFGPSNGFRIVARFGGKKVAKSAPKKSSSANVDRPLWYPGCKPPAWLDDSLVGDDSFDPLNLAKPAKYLQFDFDSLNQNLAREETIRGSLFLSLSLSASLSQSVKYSVSVHAGWNLCLYLRLVAFFTISCLWFLLRPNQNSDLFISSTMDCHIIVSRSISSEIKIDLIWSWWSSR